MITRRACQSRFWFLLGAIAFAACGAPTAAKKLPAPTLAPRDDLPRVQETEVASDGMVKTRTTETVDILHGVTVADPYRWLEDGESEEVRTWTDAQNEYTRKSLDPIPGREKLRADIAELLSVGVVGAPVVAVQNGARRYFHMRREGNQNQPVLYVREGATGKDRPLIDAAALSPDGTSALDWWFPSWDGRFVAWGRSEGGSEDSVLFVRNVTNGVETTERIDRTRHTQVAWLPDSSAFYYVRYPEKGTVPAGEENYHGRVYLHRLGDASKNDVLVFGEGRDKTDVPQVLISPDGRHLVVRVHMGWDKSEILARDLTVPNSPWIEVATKANALFDPIVRNDRLYIVTNDLASRFALFAVDWAATMSKSRWKRLIAEGTDVLHDVVVTDKEIIASFLHEGSSRIERFGRDGASRGAIALPELGTAAVTASSDGKDVFVTQTSFVVPATVRRVDAAGKLAVWDAVSRKPNVADIEVTRMYATSKDGTRVPMFVVAKKGFAKDGERPAILYGYGGFNVNQTPMFSPRALASVQRGAIWVTAVLRGGGELGEAWHRAGMLEKKQNVFDDFIACAEALIAAKITNPSKLGIVGGSNGGLLVSAAVVQRPDLFRAGLSLVPLTDMLRYHLFRIGRLWIPEYGSPDDPAQFPFLHAYSPYHRVKHGEKYPAMLFTTAESDSRVDPLHARKMAARMQAAQGDAARKILLRVESKAGHGAGKPVSKLGEELVDELSFLLTELGIDLDPASDQHM